VAVLVEDRLDGLFDGLVVGEVAGVRVCRPTGGTDLYDDLVEFFASPGDEQDRRPCGGDGRSRGSTDAGGTRP